MLWQGKDFLSLREITKEKTDRFVYIQIKHCAGQTLIKKSKR